MEFLDIVDERDKLTGIVINRQKAHEQNLWHRHVSSWILNEQGKVLMQRRSFKKDKNPRLWSKTGGHVLTKEEPKNAMLRELKEELGIGQEKLLEIEFLKVFKSKNVNDHYFAYDYFILTNAKIDELRFLDNEVIDAKYFTIDELIDLKRKNDQNFTFSKWDNQSFDNEIKMLEDKKTKIKRKA